VFAAVGEETKRTGFGPAETAPGPGGTNRFGTGSKLAGMEHWKGLLLALRFLTLLVVVYVGWVVLNRYARLPTRRQTEDAARQAEFARIYGGSEVKILQFYAREASVTEGGKTVICYGVLNARSVEIAPPLDGVGVSLNRCVEAAPERVTKYTLTARGYDGRTISESFELPVVADPDTLPKITYFRVAERKKDYLGRPLFVLAYANRNAEEVSIDPPVFEPLRRSPLGRFYVRPERTTTYTLTVKGKYNHTVSQKLTVEVPPRS
jgi:hypothetical protein